MNRHAVALAGAALAAAAAAAAGYWAGAHHMAPAGAAPHAPAPARKVLYWYDPMAPDKHFDHGGASPLMPSMQLVPKYADAADGGGAPTVRIDPRVQQNLGLRTALVRVAALAPSVRVPAVVDWDRRRSQVVSARAAGVLSRLYVRAPFDRVRAGQALAVLESPQWASAIAELRALEHAQSPQAHALLAAARQRLRVLGISEAEIAGLDHAPAGGIVLRAPVSGTVSVLDVRAGQSVEAGSELMRIDDPSRLWVDARIPQAEVAGVDAGTPVRIEVDAFPGRVYHGRVEALLPEVDPATRAQTARIALANPGGELAPGMFATVELSPRGGTPHPLVPDQALISTGTHNRVIVDLGGGRLQPRDVRVGASADGYTEVLAGLSGGERVVTSAQFLVDSEAELDGALARLQPPQPVASAASAPAAATPAAAAASAPRRVLYWYDPMVPGKHFDQGGPSPLMAGMNLVPKYASAPGAQR
ncbi:cation efflux system protein CusB precursor [mine drainage metagenome]|jgi:Cu(I)/Ag(I) efflux system membrane fusion protein|uniref:Cation efflux system protein CusB n=1 Tax=mine drainage metagenome TaxID=410659 RepID=A0A1J5RIQ5_9ZZZZ